MSLSRNSNTIGDLTKAARKRSKMPKIQTEEESPSKSNYKVEDDKLDKNKKNTQTIKEATQETAGDIGLTLRPRTQVRVKAYSMEKIKALMNIKDIQYSHEVVDYLIDIAEEHMFTKKEQSLYDAQMEFQRLKFKENGWDTEN